MDLREILEKIKKAPKPFETEEWPSFILGPVFELPCLNEIKKIGKKLPVFFREAQEKYEKIGKEVFQKTLPSEISVKFQNFIKKIGNSVKHDFPLFVHVDGIFDGKKLWLIEIGTDPEGISLILNMNQIYGITQNQEFFEVLPSKVAVALPSSQNFYTPDFREITKRANEESKEWIFVNDFSEKELKEISEKEKGIFYRATTSLGAIDSFIIEVSRIFLDWVHSPKIYLGSKIFLLFSEILKEMVPLSFLTPVRDEEIIKMKKSQRKEWIVKPTANQRSGEQVFRGDQLTNKKWQEILSREGFIVQRYIQPQEIEVKGINFREEKVDFKGKSKVSGFFVLDQDKEKYHLFGVNLTLRNSVRIHGATDALIAPCYF